MTSPAQALADRLEVEGRQVLTESYAETVQVRHVPPTPGDGQVARSILLAMGNAELDAIARALPDDDARRTTITVDGDVVRMTTRVRGTLPDGSDIAYDSESELEVDERGVIAMTVHTAPDALAEHRRLLAAGGFQVPDEVRNAPR